MEEAPALTSENRTISAGLFMTLDGVVESPEKWSFDSFDQDMMSSLSTHIEKLDTVLLGRVTYQEWAPFWPNSTDEPYATFINGVTKYVVSSTLDNVEWGGHDNVHLIKGNLAEQIALHKKRPGKEVGVQGSPTLVRSMLRNDLLDELTLMIYPVVAGSGRRLFLEGDELRRMRLVNSQTTRSGVAIMTYQPGPAA